MNQTESNSSSSKKKGLFSSIEYSFSLFLFISLSLLILLTSFVTYYNLGQQVETIHNNKIKREVRSFSEHLNTLINHYSLLIEDQAKQPLLIQSVMQPESNQGKIVDFMKTFYLFGEQHQEVLLDFLGQKIHSTLDAPNFDYQKEPWINEMIDGKSDHLYEISFADEQTFLRIASPVKLGNNVEGILVTEIPFNNLEIFNSTGSYLESSYLEITHKGKFVKSVGKPLPFESQSISLPDLELTISLTLDQTPWINSNQTFLRNLTITLGLIALTVLLSSIFFGRTFFTNRIKSLSAGTQEFIQGNLEYRVKYQGQDEIADLSENFNTLGKQLMVTLDELENEKNSLESKVKERTAELEQKAKDLLMANKYKSEFLANMSHELRTPLNSLLVLSQLLKDNSKNHLDEEEVQLAKTVHESGTFLLTMINDLLDLSKVEAGKMTLHIDNVDINYISNYLTQHFNSQNKNKQINFSITIAEELPTTFISDSQRVLQILRNLLSNAIKFTESGMINIKIQRPPANLNYQHPHLNHNNTLDFCVSDTGIGIPPDKQEFIFETFKQVDGSQTRHYGGTGLGLSLSREFSKLLKGQMHLDSKEGVGSNFHLILPINFPNYETLMNYISTDENSLETSTDFHSASKKPTNKSQKEDESLTFKFQNEKVLLIEEDIRTIYSLSNLLEQHNLKTLPASNHEEALEQTQKHKDISFILVDYNIYLNQKECLDELKRSTSTFHTKLFSLKDSELSSKDLDDEFEDNISKPIDSKHLLKSLRAVAIHDSYN